MDKDIGELLEEKLSGFKADIDKSIDPFHIPLAKFEIEASNDVPI